MGRAMYVFANQTLNPYIFGQGAMLPLSPHNIVLGNIFADQ